MLHVACVAKCPLPSTATFTGRSHVPSRSVYHHMTRVRVPPHYTCIFCNGVCFAVPYIASNCYVHVMDGQMQCSTTLLCTARRRTPSHTVNSHMPRTTLQSARPNEHVQVTTLRSAPLYCTRNRRIVHAVTVLYMQSHVGTTAVSPNQTHIHCSHSPVHMCGGNGRRAAHHAR